MHPADEHRFDALMDALTSEHGCNGAMRRAIRHNEAIEREERERMILASFSEHEARIHRRVAAHEHETRNLLELSWPIIVAMWGRLPWRERARLALALVLPW